MTKYKGDYKSMICANIHVSQSEISALDHNYTYDWIETKKELLLNYLYDLGLDVTKHFEFQEPVQHYNRMKQRVTCGRYYGEERLDDDWINSGLASKEAKDKIKNSYLTDDLYRQKGLTVDAQMALERKDLFATTVEDEEIY